MKDLKQIFLIFTVIFISCQKTNKKQLKNFSQDVLIKTEAESLNRMQWWKDAKYGMFIHWGLYSELAGEYKGEITPTIAEWIQNTLKIPLSEYKKIMKEFYPVKFDADFWASIAKAAGMKYVILTSKHHDGFALFDSKVSDYDIMNTPYNKDIVKQLKEACKKQGLKFGLYYSHVIDWEHPHAYTGEGKLKNRMNSLDYDPNKMDRSKFLKEKSYPQLREILTNYGKIDVIWFDMGGGLDKNEINEFVKITRELQPEIIISSRIGNSDFEDIFKKERSFDFYTPSDNYYTGDDLPIPWEMCGTTNGSWGYRNDDHEWRDPKMIVSSLVASVSRNGNYLLNVGPNANGEIPNDAVKNLLEAGKWLQNNKDAIYGAKGSSFPWNYKWGFVTEKSNKIFLNVFNYPKNNIIELNGLMNSVNSVSILNNKKELKYKQNGRFLSIDIKEVKQDSIAITLVVNYSDDKQKINPLISQSLNNSIRLDRIAGHYDKEVLETSWEFEVNTIGKYKIELLSNEKARHSNPKWVGSDQKGTLEIGKSIIPVSLKRDKEEINKSLFFYKEITSNIGYITFLEKGKQKLILKNFEINAGKWKSGLGLNYIQLTLVK
jgi:alpha-L-fucosidase